MMANDVRTMCWSIAIPTMERRMKAGLPGLLISLAFTGLYLPSVQAASSGCEWDASSAINSIINTRLTIGGAITVGQDVPIGTVVYSQRIVTNGGNGGRLLCQAGSYDLLTNLTSSPYGKSSYSDATYPYVFNTNVRGIGIALWHGTPDGSTTEKLVIPGRLNGYFSHTTPTVYNFTEQLDASVNFNIVFIKTEEGVESKTINSRDLPQFTSAFSGNGIDFIYQRTGVIGSLTVIPGTCNVGNSYYLPLNEHYVDEFNGIDSTAGEAKTELVLADCPAFYGTMSYGVIKSNVMTLQLSPRNGTINADRGIAAINSTVSDPATGVGVQLSLRQANGSYELAKLDQLLDLSRYIDFSDSEGGHYQLGIKAAYIQTADKITAGAADAQIEFMITYR